MRKSMARRDFLLATPAAVGALAMTARGDAVPALDRLATGAATDAPDPIAIAASAPLRAGYPLRAKRHAEVRLSDSFWQPKVQTNARVTIPFEFDKREEGGRGINNNVLEAAILSLEAHPDPVLQRRVEARVAQIAAQRPSGNRGFEVAAAWYLATGRRDLLDPAIGAADAIRADFAANDPPFNGGERDAVNCIQLYRVTGERAYLDLAKHYLDIRGRADSVNRSRHNQAHAHVLQQREAAGHAVNCVTLMVSLADAGVLSGDGRYLDSARAMWRDAAARKMYVTGGVGTTGNEGFGEPYSLPNISAYSETCAVLMFITLNHRLFLESGDARYIDVMERGMYNNALSGVAASGDRYFYVNRLASAGDGRDHRWQHASLECCPPNLVRFLAGMPGLIYAQDEDDRIHVNLYISSEADFNVKGRPLSLSVDSEMPWGGRTTLRVSTTDAARGGGASGANGSDPSQATTAAGASSGATGGASGVVPATLRLRIPGWTVNRPDPEGLYSYYAESPARATIAVNGSAIRVRPDRLGYVSIERDWADGDVVDVEFPMEVRRVVADSRVRECARRIAIERGPIVYCAEFPDVAGGRVLDLVFEREAPLTPSHDPRFFGGATLIRTEAARLSDASSARLSVTLIPYHLWANRGTGEMTVWLPTEPYRPGDVGPGGGLIFFENPNYATDGWRYLEAAPFDQSSGAPWGCFRSEVDGARGTAIGTGKQNTADILAACDDPVSAASLCANLKLNGVSGWFLPSRDELAEMYTVLAAKGLGDFHVDGMIDNAAYWASSQNTTDMAAHIDFADFGRLHGDDKDFPRRVRAVRAF